MPKLGPLDVPIQSQALCELFKLKSDSETSQTASDWIGAFNGPNVRTHPEVLSHFASLPHARL